MPPVVEVDGNAAGDDPIHHQPMAEQLAADPQDLLAQQSAMGVQQREGGVVGDEADVVDVVGDSLELGQQRAKPDRSRWGLAAGRSLDGAGEGELIGYRAVAGDTPDDAGRAGEVGPGE